MKGAFFLGGGGGGTTERGRGESRGKESLARVAAHC